MAIGESNVIDWHREHAAINVEFTVNWDGGGFWDVFNTTFDEAGDNTLELVFTRGVTDVLTIAIHDIRFHAFKMKKTSDKFANYIIQGTAFYDGTNEPITVTPNDGHTYT